MFTNNSGEESDTKGIVFANSLEEARAKVEKKLKPTYIVGNIACWEIEDDFEIISY